jgi:uncharacterized protein
MICIAALYTYPVKSCRGIAVQSAVVEPWGLAGDRRWMVVDERGRFLTQRNIPQLALIRPEPLDSGLRLTAPGCPPLLVETPVNGEPIQVRVWSDKLVARLAGADASAWLTACLGRSARLVWLDDPTRRRVNRAYGRAAETVSFADGYPLLVTSEASLTHLNGWLMDPLPMNRFRPNLVVSGAPAWAEDRWTRLRIGPVVLRMASLCGRCVVTTTDQETLERGAEPLRALAAYRNIDGKLVFGRNAIPETTGIISVGDPVEPAG